MSPPPHKHKKKMPLSSIFIKSWGGGWLLLTPSETNHLIKKKWADRIDAGWFQRGDTPLVRQQQQPVNKDATGLQTEGSWWITSNIQELLRTHPGGEENLYSRSQLSQLGKIANLRRIALTFIMSETVRLSYLETTHQPENGDILKRRKRAACASQRIHPWGLIVFPFSGKQTGICSSVTSAM